MLAVHTPDGLRAAVAAGDLTALIEGPRHRPQGRPADRARAQGPARRPDRRPARPHRRPGRRRPGATRCVEALVGLGWSAKQADGRRRRGRRRRARSAGADARRPGAPSGAAPAAPRAIRVTDTRTPVPSVSRAAARWSSPGADDDDRAVEAALRPKRLGRVRRPARRARAARRSCSRPPASAAHAARPRAALRAAGPRQDHARR